MQYVSNAALSTVWLTRKVHLMSSCANQSDCVLHVYSNSYEKSDSQVLLTVLEPDLMVEKGNIYFLKQ